MKHRTLVTFSAACAVAALAGCSGHVDTGEPGQSNPGPDPAPSDDPEGDASGPSSDWHIAHAMSRGAREAPLALRAEDVSGQPVVGATFCSIHGATCADTDADGRAELALAAGRHVISGFSEGFARSAITLAADEAMLGVGDIAYRLHTMPDLGAVYAAVGAEPDRRLGTVVLELVGERAAGVRATLTDVRGHTLAGVYVDADGRVSPELDATSERGVVYLLDVAPGSVTVALSHDGAPCEALETEAWPSETPSAVDTLAVSGGLTFAGFVDCS